MILKARHHPVIHPFFIRYGEWKMKLHFHGAQILGSCRETALPVMLVANHVSWWDGFWASHFNALVLKRKLYFMMLEEQLLKYRYFRNAGGYSVRKGSRSILETIDYTAGLLSDSRNAVLMFPQGKIESLYQREFSFERGIGKILQKLNGDVQIVFLANLVDYYSLPKPSLFIHCMDFQEARRSVDILQKEYNDFYRRCIAEHIRRTGE